MSFLGLDKSAVTNVEARNMVPLAQLDFKGSLLSKQLISGDADNIGNADVMPFFFNHSGDDSVALADKKGLGLKSVVKPIKGFSQ